MHSKHDHLTYAVMAAFGAAFLLSIMNMLAKLLSTYIDAVEITFWRNLIGLALLLAGLAIFKKLSYLRTQRIWAQLWRAVIGTIGMILGVWSLSFLSITEANAYGFTAPLFVVILSIPLLGERVGWRRILATLIGFSGIFIILGQAPWDLSLNIGAVIAITASFCNALVMISLRWLGRTENAITTVFYFFGFGLIGTGLAMPFMHSPLPTESVWLLAPLGVVGLSCLLLKTESYRRGAATVVAPLTYVIILWSALWDWLVWGSFPAMNIWIGAAFIMGSNLFILYREHRLNINKTGPRQRG